MGITSLPTDLILDLPSIAVKATIVEHMLFVPTLQKVLFN